MTKEKLIKWFNEKNTVPIYGLQYGHRTQYPIEEDIIEIPSYSLFLSLGKDCFGYVWGWPGPDWNKYKFEDYGKTFSFDKEELIKYWSGHE